MNVIALRELNTDEQRVPLVPADAAKMVEMGAQLQVEAGIGTDIGHADAAYTEAGATVVADRAALLGAADLVLRLSKPQSEDIALMKQGAIHVSYLDPFNETGLVKELKAAGISAISMEMIPRTTLAQKMDALSSQANLGGYVAVILAAERMNRIFPMMMTPSGTIPPAKVFIIGAGVAGLQAIATAKRLGARVEAFDTRPVVAEQVESLGGRFVKVDLGETGQTKDGYAKALTPEQLEIQRQTMAKHAAGADVVITTAQLFGRPAPRILTRDMVEAMKPGSIVIDMAVESGGNVEGSQLGEEVDINGVRVIGLGNLPGRVAADASLMYSSNLFNLVEQFWDKEAKEMKLNLEDEIIDGCLIIHEGAIRNETIKSLVEGNGDEQ
ncbi:MAG: Re/Si-specific NAD(P)(+) transhydrogenase subunit alpha [Verrucomicrobia bacterium]|jgi:H+-translocating NAD(P) transhydrogenase subunit alpha|nr:Re/Si-specific NAD(P)(+) transhydrogenase subunit alpha [Verrucomicrobiota bacterium]MBT7068466.1 Re/Si-specific NAD(P)(+) transhydrogenase subunit alpha [Verrucomicrobiota bacterium]MBT7699297.1 Re/Si-specific NAD(P)(+) transhydrogenase subunit alpha [Verrucomicrobiota bacterium]